MSAIHLLSFIHFLCCCSSSPASSSSSSSTQISPMLSGAWRCQFSLRCRIRKSRPPSSCAQINSIGRLASSGPFADTSRDTSRYFELASGRVAEEKTHHTRDLTSRASHLRDETKWRRDILSDRKSAARAHCAIANARWQISFVPSPPFPRVHFSRSS